MRLVLDDKVRLVVGATTAAVACPSCASSGLKLNPQGTIAVQPGGSVQLTLVFDVQESLRIEQERFVLRPVIRIESATIR